MAAGYARLRSSPDAYGAPPTPSRSLALRHSILSSAGERPVGGTQKLGLACLGVIRLDRHSADAPDYLPRQTSERARTVTNKANTLSSSMTTGWTNGKKVVASLQASGPTTSPASR